MKRMLTRDQNINELPVTHFRAEAAMLRRRAPFWTLRERELTHDDDDDSLLEDRTHHRGIDSPASHVDSLPVDAQNKQIDV